MEYVKGKPYFCLNGEKIASYPYLDRNISCELLIIGGGVDGAIANYYLSQNHDVVLVDKDRFGCSCTSCATALLEYQLDDFASELKTLMTEQEIVEVYKMGLYAIDKIEQFVKEKGNECYFKRRPSLLFSNNIFDVKKIEEEFEFRKRNNFLGSLITPQNNNFQFDLQRGIFCEDGGAEIDPYHFAKQLIENSKNQNKIFENTKIEVIKHTEQGVVAQTNYGEKIFCKKVLIATGFNWEVINKSDLCERFVSYTIVTSPIQDFDWYEKALIQDCKEPYHYLRFLPGNRIIFGGEDTPFNQKCIKEKTAYKKYNALEKELFKLFPILKDKISIDYKFCGSFGSTDNNLGLMGESDEKDVMYFISCGANGIVNAVYAVEIIEDILNNRHNKLEHLFSPLRE